METYWLRFTLLSDATFGRGDGVAGLVDREVEHDADGMPYLRGRTLKGLLAEECANILFALGKQNKPLDRWYQAAQRVFGRPGSTLADDALMRVGDARLPADLRAAIHHDVEARRFHPAEMMEALTAIRHQTAVNVEGAPERGTLRAMRVVLRGTPFEAELAFAEPAQPDDLALLAACILGLRRAGTGRNRGRGRLMATLHDARGNDITRQQFEGFTREVRP